LSVICVGCVDCVICIICVDCIIWVDCIICIGLEVWANNGGGFVGIDVDIIGNQIGGNWLGLSK
jgi:hypothetical protein